MKYQDNRALFSVLNIAAWMLFFSACPDTTGKKTTETCDIHNNDETACKAATDKDGKQCQYDVATKTCAPQTTIPQVLCKDLDEAKCKASKICTFDVGKTPPCEDAPAAVSGKCEAVQTQKDCEDDTTCKWDASVTPNVCKTGAAPMAAKTIVEFKLAQVPKAEYGIVDDTTIKDVIASGNGDNLYVIGTANEALKAFSLTANKWAGIISFKFRKATDKKTFNFKGKPILLAASLEDGFLGWVSQKGPIQVQKGSIVAWQQNTNNIPDVNADGLGEHFNGTDRFLIMSVGAGKAGSILFIGKQNIGSTDPKYPANWANDFAQDINTPNVAIPPTKRYSQFLSHDNGMLMLEKGGVSVDYAKDNNIRAGQLSGIIDSGTPNSGGALNYITAAAWKHSGAENPALKLAKMNKYLVAIFPTTGPDTGGIALYDTSTNADPKDPASWKWADKAMNCANIIVIKHNPKASVNDHLAVITAKEGFALLLDDELKLVNGFPLIYTANSATAVVANYATASSGAAAGSAALPAQGANTEYVGAGELRNGDVYLGIKGNGANDGGLYRLNLETKTIQAP